ncbi:ROK family transcriptional regulator [Winogradskya consettensis]|uniref:Uncharacterized protein n=1 Tax=Winogradskya consettensis TaxID=113560 RepID=A0A919SGC3_9ACTN|nr:ROK family transcriptional regulator [Actinoplanes consettensis]GIM71087.1 hypothetical protein Aco04nite_23690 [Actinoplanes consettensis]
MDPAKPSLDLLRTLTDEHVLRGLMRHRRLTRAELATETGISKPTIGESVRRLTELGLLADTGERTPGGRGRGRVGSYYALTASAGTALAVSIGPDGVIAERIDVYGETLARATHPLDTPATPDQIATALDTAVTGCNGDQPARLAVVSAADPVNRHTGRIMRLPDAPFLLGDLDPVAVLTPHVTGPITVDNDVNWAARAERDAALNAELDAGLNAGPDAALNAGLDARRDPGLNTGPNAGLNAGFDAGRDAARDPGREPGLAQPADFAYLHLGEGLGCAIVSDGEVRRGTDGLAGEISHLVTNGPHGNATTFIQVFGELGLRIATSTAIDTARLIAAATAPGAQATAVRSTISRAVGGVTAAIVALTNPAAIVIGGSWGTHPALLSAIIAVVAHLPRPVPVHPATIPTEPALTGARTEAIALLRTAVVAAAAR